MPTNRGKQRAAAILSACALATLSIAGHTTADEISSTYTGGLDTTYVNPNIWSPAVVPNNGNGNTYDVDLAGGLIQLASASVTIDNLAGGGGGLFVTDASLAVNGSSDLGLGYVTSNTANASVSLGSFAEFSDNTLSNTVIVVSSNGTGTATLQFNGADIVNNAATIGLSGQAAITDEKGNDALRHFAVNNGIFNLDSRTFTTAGDFSNPGSLALGSDGATAPTNFIVTGNLSNYDSATHTLSGGGFQFLGSVSTKLQFNNADIIHNESSLEFEFPGEEIVDQFGNNGLRNLADNGTNGVISFREYPFTTSGDFSNSGVLEIGAPFTVNGNLSNYSSNKLTGGNFGFFGSGQIQFNNANIINNAATLNIAVSTPIIDQFGNNGLRNLAHNLPSGMLNIGSQFTTSGDFLNDGTLSVVPSPPFLTVGLFSPIFGPPLSSSFSVNGSFTNTGTVSVNSYGTFTAQLYIQSSGTTELQGGVLSAPTISIHSGSFGGTGKVIGPVTIEGELFTDGNENYAYPNNGTLAIQGPITLTGTATDSFRIGTTYADVSSSVSAAIAGTLQVALDLTDPTSPASASNPPEYIPLPTDQFIILSAPEIDGEFDNGPDGSRLETTDGYGSFLVEYLPAENGDPAEVVLTDFETGTPEPTAMLSVFTFPLLLLGRRKRRHR